MVGLLTAICLKAETFPVGRKLFASRENSQSMVVVCKIPHTSKVLTLVKSPENVVFFLLSQIPSDQGPMALQMLKMITQQD